MAIVHIHTFLVYPDKGADEANAIVGNSLPQEGAMFRLVRGIYEQAAMECEIGIAFTPAEDGKQVNPCRDLLLAYADNPSVRTGRPLAARLASATTKRSGLGLLFLIYGQEGTAHKIVASRFPANNGVLVEEKPDRLTVEFIDRVFMKNSYSYKAAFYQHRSLRAGFWEGHAVDKQINSRDSEASNYWVREFLASDFRTTPALGTRRLAIALRDAGHHSTDPAAAGLNGELTSTNDFLETYHLTPATREAINKAFGRTDLATEQFRFDATEFAAQLPYKTTELDTGALLTAPTGRFDDVFETEVVGGGEVRISAKGKIVSEQFEKRRDA